MTECVSEGLSVKHKDVEPNQETKLSLDTQLGNAEHGALIFSTQTAPEQKPLYEMRGMFIGDLMNKYPHLLKALQTNETGELSPAVSQAKAARIYYREGDVLIVNLHQGPSDNRLLILTPEICPLISVPGTMYVNQSVNIMTGELAPFSENNIAPCIVGDGSVYLFPDKPVGKDSVIDLGYQRISKTGRVTKDYLRPEPHELGNWTQIATEHEKALLDPDYIKAKRAQETLEQTCKAIEKGQTTKERLWLLVDQVVSELDRDKIITAETHARQREKSDYGFSFGLKEALRETFGVESITKIPICAYGKEFRLTGRLYGEGATAVILEAQELGKETQVAVKFGFATKEFLHGEKDFETRKNREINRGSIVEESRNLIRVVENHKQYPSNSSFQEKDYLTVLEEGSISNIDAPIPYVVIQALPEEDVVPLSTLRHRTEQVIKSPETTLQEKEAAFKLICYLDGYFMDGCRRVYGFIPNDFQYQNLVFIPEEKRAALLDLSETRPEVYKTSWKGHLLETARDLLRWSPYYDKNFVDFCISKLEFITMFRLKRIDWSSVKYIKSQVVSRLEELRDQHIQDLQIDAYVLDQIVLQLFDFDEKKSFCEATPEGMNKVAEGLAFLAGELATAK
ncbi:hypothetical protein ISS85_02160 [Candidatus Microgenomates bacterium]|nr:hypothetical protein [Candidatus Microgenomates bacterium]